MIYLNAAKHHIKCINLLNTNEAFFPFPHPTFYIYNILQMKSLNKVKFVEQPVGKRGTKNREVYCWIVKIIPNEYI